MRFDGVVVQSGNDQAAAALALSGLDVIKNGILQVKAGEIVLGLEEHSLTNLLIFGEGHRDLSHDAILRIYLRHDIGILEIALTHDLGEQLISGHRSDVLIILGVFPRMNGRNLFNEEINQTKLLLITGKNSPGYGG